jgi:xanthine dehydrogenase YagS FAD-binding subunit
MREFNLHQALSVGAALDALGTGMRVLAGGTTLVDLMRLGVESPTDLIDISGVRELEAYDVSGSKELVFGASAPMGLVADDPALREHYPALAESLWKAASPQLRNMATLGGNLMQRTRCPYFRAVEFPCNKRTPRSGCPALDGNNRSHAVLGGSGDCIAAYPGDWAVALAAFDAVVDVLSPRGLRSIPITELHRLPGGRPDIETIVAPDELITRIRVPRTRFGRASTYHKVRDRTSYAFALASAAVAVDLDGKVVLGARIALGGVAAKPWRCRDAEASLVGGALTEDVARRAGEIAFRGAATHRHNAFKVALGIATVTEALMIAKARA